MIFTVPTQSGAYAPEIYYLKGGDAKAGKSSPPLDCVFEVRPNIISLPKDAQLEMDILKSPRVRDLAKDSSWRLAVVMWDADGGLEPTRNTLGLQTLVALSYSSIISGRSPWPGIRFRMKSGGTGGEAEVEAKHLR